MNAIKQQRLANKMTQEQVAADMNVKRSTVSMWEIGKSLPKSMMLSKLAKLFGCTIDELLRTEDEE